MVESGGVRPGRHGRIKDARGREVTQLDPVAMYLLRQHEIIPSEALRAVSQDIDPRELRRRPLALALAPVWVILWYTAWFLYFRLFSTWKGWDPVLIAFGVAYFVTPFLTVYLGFRKAKRMRWEAICRVMLRHLRCPHCGYDIRGLPTDTVDGVTVCPECGSAWSLPSSIDTHASNKPSSQEPATQRR